MSDADRSEIAAFDVPEMDCPSCATKIERSVERLAGIKSVEPVVTDGTVRVRFDPAATDADAIADRIRRAGYAIDSGDGIESDAAEDERDAIWRSGRAIKTGISGLFLALGLAVEFLAVLENAVAATVFGVEFALADLFFLVGIVAGGQVILKNGYYSARNRSLDIDLLMSLAITAAVLASLLGPETRLFSEAAVLAFLFNVAELLERYSMDRARNSLRELMDLAPEEATVRRNGTEQTVPVDAVRVGDRVIVRPGEKVPMDGVVREGESAVNQAPITGESVPVDKAPGEEVYAGTINEEGYLELEVTATASENTLSRIVSLVEDAQRNRTKREQFVDRFSGYYTPIMVGVAVLTAVVPPLVLGAPWTTWFVAGITMLVLACPCAFVISTPVAVVSGITSAARNGVLIKGGDRLEAMGEVRTVAFDKTGTLTKGELAVTDVLALNDHDEEDVLRCARGLEERSEHPIGQAIVGHAGESAIESRAVSGFESLTGRGVRADLDGITHYAGKPGLFGDLGFDLEHAHVVGEGALSADVRDLCDRQGCLNLVEDAIPRLQDEGKTAVLVGREDELEGIIAVADEVRPGARRTVEHLREAGVRTVMLTGDNERTARAVAEAVGVDDVRAELLPEDKVHAVEDLISEDGTVAMVGDGINDAPALATADVGIAMGAAGTDTALETADIALMGDDLSKLPYLYELSHRANGVIRQNVWASLAAKALLAVGVPLGYVTVAIAVLVGDAGMTVGVTGNAMRLSRIDPESFGAD
ncbi:heavy metal translocating P-type ATPase [Halalkalicoccus subterraneus]|uniref:heavy metal translocating P-type ATPase n=1 Tax=Halalkalicoccus subterraneus TaxID=2675002 RepID=UPI000EFB008D|nr:cation-translocating P-type ATPase [Halalkalicoccus subterraneus]